MITGGLISVDIWRSIEEDLDIKIKSNINFNALNNLKKLINLLKKVISTLFETEKRILIEEHYFDLIFEGEKA